MKATDNNNQAKPELTCSFPTPENPFYHLKANLDLIPGTEYQIKEVRVSGKEVLDFFIYLNGKLQNDRKVKGGGTSEVIVRYDWRSGEEIQAFISGEAGTEKDPLAIKSRVKAPHYGGHWDPSWKHYAGVVCTETAGVDRVNEPVHVTFALYSDRIADPERELRIVAIDSDTGAAEEVPSQVYCLSQYECEKPGERYQPTTIFEAAFLADVPANSSKVYLAFYGNPEAPEPTYSGGLRISGKEPGLIVENPFYTVRLAPTSGSIDEIEMKMGVNYKFEHHLETNGALQWNPDVYAPPRPWLHTSDWNPPAHFSAVTGSVFAMTKRNGPIDHYPEVEVSITYTFYDRVPWMIMTSTIEVKKDISVKALRNGEIVLNRELVDEFAWSEPGGGYGTMVIQDGPRHPKHAKVLPYHTPWACLFTRKHCCGLGMITAGLSSYNRYGGYSRTFQPYSYLQWGPWVYYARPLVYTFLSNNPGRLVTVPAGNMYWEKMAFVPVRIESMNASFDYLEKLYTRLSNPLDVKVIEDTDPRAPGEWLPPILVEEFEEMEGS